MISSAATRVSRHDTSSSAGRWPHSWRMISGGRSRPASGSSGLSGMSLSRTAKSSGSPAAGPPAGSAPAPGTGGAGAGFPGRSGCGHRRRSVPGPRGRPAGARTTRCRRGRAAPGDRRGRHGRRAGSPTARTGSSGSGGPGQPRSCPGGAAGHQHHDQPVPRRQARPQQRGDLLVAGPVHRRSSSRSRCRARNRCAIRPSSPRAPAGRSRSSATSYSNGTRCAGACPAATACVAIPRTAASTPFTRRAPRAGEFHGPASTSPAPSASPSRLLACGPACRSQVMNNPRCSIPACQDRPVRPHHRKNNAIPPAYAFVVSSKPSRPNRTSRKNTSASGTTHSSSSSTVQYRSRTAASPQTPAPHPPFSCRTSNNYYQQQEHH